MAFLQCVLSVTSRYLRLYSTCRLPFSATVRHGMSGVIWHTGNHFSRGGEGLQQFSERDRRRRRPVCVNQHARGKKRLWWNWVRTRWRDTHTQVAPEAFSSQKLRHLSVGKLYRFKRPQVLLGLFVLTGILTWFAGIPLAIFSDYVYAIVGLMVLRIILLTITTHLAVKRFGQRFEVWATPFLDFVYSFYYLQRAS